MDQNWVYVNLHTNIFKSWKYRTVIRKYFYSKRGLKKLTGLSVSSFCPGMQRAARSVTPTLTVKKNLTSEQTVSVGREGCNTHSPELDTAGHQQKESNWNYGQSSEGQLQASRNMKNF